MKVTNSKKQNMLFFGAIIVYMILAVSVDAGSFQHEKTIEKIMNSLSGPVAGIVSVVAVVIGGVGYIIGRQSAESNETMKLIFGLVFLMGIVLFAPQLVTTMGGTTSAAVI